MNQILFTPILFFTDFNIIYTLALRSRIKMGNKYKIEIVIQFYYYT